MPDQKKATATAVIWRDHHSGKRGHQLMIETLANAIPTLGANENVADCDDILAHAKLFSPYSNWTWYIAEWDAETGQCFGLVEGLERELGYFDLTELAETTVFGDVPAVERDLYWQPMTLGKIKDGSRRVPPRHEANSGGETMTDKTGTEIHSSDVVNVEEFLFGAAATDATADVAAELPAEDVADNAGDLETAREPDVDTDAAEEPDAGDEPTLAETEATEELKVVLSIKGSRATIGVQRPAADPHIESFDDPDLFGLADQFPAVVARARARWEEEPMHSAYDRPAPPARQRNRRQQGTAQAATAEAVEPEQPQAETLRLF